MTFQQLLYVVEVSNCGSINKAARNLNLSQSSISIAIKELEKEINITFFNRTNHGITLTNNGKEFLLYATALLEQKKQIEELYDKKNDRKGSITFSVASQRYHFVEDAFVRLMNDFKDDDYYLSLKDLSFDNVVEEVYSQNSEIGIIFLTTLSEKIIYRLLASKDLKFKELMTLKPAVYVNKKHPLCKLKVVKASDLLNYPYITYRQTIGLSNTFSEEYQVAPIHKFKKHIITNSRATEKKLIVETDAIATGCGIVTEDEYKRNIVPLPIDSADNVKIGYIYREGANENTITKKFIKYLNDALKEAKKFSESIK